MEKITSINELKNAIQDLEYKSSCEWKLLKEEVSASCESLRPINLIKSELKRMTLAPGLKTTLLNSAIGLASGFIAKKVLVGKQHNPLMKLVGIAVEMVVANKVTENPEGIKTIARIIFKKLFAKQTAIKI